MGDDHNDMEHILDLPLWLRVTEPDPYDADNLPVRDEPTWGYIVIHPDGALEHRTAGRRGIRDHLRYAQGDVIGELGTEDLTDLVDIDAAWWAPLEREGLPDNPVANRMIQVFDLGKVVGEARGIVAFTPAFYREGRGVRLDGHRLTLFLKIHAEIRKDLAAGRDPRQRLWPSEMITASRGVDPQQAWEEFQRARERLAPDEKITDVIRRREELLRAGRDPDND